MALTHSPSIVRDGLVLHLDAANVKSYPGSGSTWYDLSGNGITFSPDSGVADYDGTSFSWDFESTELDTFISSNSPITYSDNQYTRIVWFNAESINAGSDVAYIFGNKIGNNMDMCIGISESKLTFHQYTRAAEDGISNKDYHLKGNTNLSSTTWYMGCFTFDKSNLILKLYINGELDREITNTRPVGNAYSNQMMVGGADSPLGHRTYDGKVSIVQHYSRVLSLEEIKQNFEALRGRYGI